MLSVAQTSHVEETCLKVRESRKDHGSAISGTVQSRVLLLPDSLPDAGFSRVREQDAWNTLLAADRIKVPQFGNRRVSVKV